jgi:penicillin-binding protein 2
VVDVKSGWRLGTVGLIFIVMFAVLTLQLWQVQVVAGEKYVQEAQNSQVKFVATPAARGEIVDRAGRQLAGTQAVRAAVVNGALIPEESVPHLVSLLAAFTGMDASTVEEIVTDARNRADRVVLKSDLSLQDAVYLAEHGDDFVGVSVVDIPQRIYPFGNLASGVIGYIGRPSQADLDAGAKYTDILGKAGLEKQYDDQLQGTEGAIKYQVDAHGNVLAVLGEEFPQAGNKVITELDVDLQKVLEQALTGGLELARTEYNPDGCDPGSAEDGTEDKGCPVRAVGVVLDVNTGAVRAMASVPNFDPGLFVNFDQAEYDALPDGALTNFAVQGQYAPASTFKALTYVMAMEEGIAPEGATSVEDPILCAGQLNAEALGEGSLKFFQNWTRRDDGMQDIHRAFRRSCNTYFWEIALSLWNQYKETAKENLLQDWARAAGFDKKTGIDLPFEKSGIIPDRALFERWAADGDPRLDASRLQFASPWFGGDLFQAAVGQGSVLATPIQMAMAYGALVNGGTVYQPRVVSEIQTEDGHIVQTFEPVVANVLTDLSASTVRSLRNDMQQVVNNPEGTAHTAFLDFGANVTEVGGKTGTAEIIKAQTDDNGNVVQDSVTTALFVGVAPIDDPEYVVMVVVERGGSGGRIAAATAKPVLQYLLGEDVTDITPGQKAD